MINILKSYRGIKHNTFTSDITFVYIDSNLDAGLNELLCSENIYSYLLTKHLTIPLWLKSGSLWINILNNRVDWFDLNDYHVVEHSVLSHKGSFSLTSDWTNIMSILMFASINTLTPQRCGNNFTRLFFFKFFWGIDIWSTSCEVCLRRRKPQNLTDDTLILVQVIAWCHQAASHYLSQCWPIFILSFSLTRSQTN